MIIKKLNKDGINIITGQSGTGKSKLINLLSFKKDNCIKYPTNIKNIDYNLY